MHHVILKSDNECQLWPVQANIWLFFLPLNSKCDLDLGDIDVILLHDTLSDDGEQMYQVI